MRHATPIARTVTTTTRSRSGPPPPPPARSKANGRRRERPPVPQSSPPQLKIVRPRGLGPASKPGAIAAPSHHHLPGWVRRAFSQAQPILADLLGALEGTRREQLTTHIEEVTAEINAGKFSRTWLYPRLIEEGQDLLASQRREVAEQGRAKRALEAARRRVSEQLRTAGAEVAPDVVSRLNRSLKECEDPQGVAQVESELRDALAAARANQDRRREREIGRTRSKILKSLPRTAPEADTSETWQDTLRRFLEQQQEGDQQSEPESAVREVPAPAGRTPA